MKARINWNEGFANDPNLEIFEEDTKIDWVYEQRGSLYFAVDPETSRVSFFSYKGPGLGYGGRTFTIKMKDGTTKDLIGPYSSRCSVMNEAGFPHSVEVTIITPEGHYRSGALLVEKAMEYLNANGREGVLGYFPKSCEYMIIPTNP